MHLFVGRNDQNMAQEIKDKWSKEQWALLPDVVNAAELAHKGILTSVQNLCLKELDISKVEVDKIAKLAAIVTNKVRLYYSSKVPKNILNNVRSSTLELFQVTLSRNETKDLVTSMRQRIKKLRLNFVDMHNVEFNKYRFGRQKCTWIGFDDYTYTTADDNGYSFAHSFDYWENWSVSPFYNAGAHLEKDCLSS